MSVNRCYSEKKNGFDVEARSLFSSLHDLLEIKNLTHVRYLCRYDAEGLAPETYEKAKGIVFSEPMADVCYDEDFPRPEGAHTILAVEPLPGQFDQRADSCEQCIQLLTGGERPTVAAAKIYVLEGELTAEDMDKIRGYLINPVDTREASMDKPATLKVEYAIPTSVASVVGFTHMDESALSDLLHHMGLAMDLDDLKFLQTYFRDTEKRDPTITEVRMVDTYWSDHCRHTTFLTQIDDVKFEDQMVQDAFDRYMAARVEVYGEEKAAKRPVTLMDMGTIAAKVLKKRGYLKNIDESEEINACSIKVKALVNGHYEDWLLMFKNETHNHPTEIEPFGGAATCLGGAIRDPLSGRSYVYQAMRVTGAGDPTVPLSETLEHKLPQRKLCQTAAAGYSSYGNQIGLATGLVHEIYHPGYVAKRMEIGAVVGAAPLENVIREVPEPGDIVILLGGKTGRDGCGGATGSSKKHTEESLETCGAEVQKGNPPEERKIQRLFRDGNVTRMIRRCNDFGAGGVSVAIGELADGLSIDLNAVPKKYNGLDGTELAISESQERMAVVVAKEDAEKFIAAANRENLEATVVAEVTAEPRLVMRWNGNIICDIKRKFLNSNGAEKHMDVRVPARRVAPCKVPEGTLEEKLTALMSDLNTCSKKGLSERFDSTIGAGTVLMPFGGRTQLTPVQAMAAKLPVPHGETKTCSGMAWGYNPFIAEQSEYHSAYLAVTESVSKLVATGFSAKNAYLTFQEYFERLGADPTRWGRPMASLLGALDAQVELGVAAIGGKDSMSGSFENIDVPPTLVSFAVAAGNTDNVVSPEFKLPGSKLVLLSPAMRDGLLPNAGSLKLLWAQVETLIKEKKVLSAYTPSMGGLAEALFKMGLGNRLGVRFAPGFDAAKLFGYAYGSFVLELAEDIDVGTPIGETTARYVWELNGETADLAKVQEAYEAKLEPVLPYRTAEAAGPAQEAPALKYEALNRVAPKVGTAKPRVLIPVFPGTNCEYDSARAMERAGAEPEVFVINNLTPAHVAESVAAVKELIGRSQMIFLPGGFSGGDEPEGSAKFITAFFRNPAITEAVRGLLQKRDGLMLGICNGFQALIKLGLVPFGDIVETDDTCPTLTFNTIGRHQSMLVRTRVASNLSPWLQYTKPGDVHTVAVSHGEGRFVAGTETLDRLVKNGQIATQYVDLSGKPTMDVRHNPNGSYYAVEGITSPDGRVLGKMGHSERSGDNLYKNVDGNKYQKLFEGGVDYFKL